MNNDTCYTCGGDGTCCLVHSSPEGCDCEDSDREHECPDCHGTGISNEGEEDGAEKD